MSTDIASDRIIPDTLLYSIFRNCTPHLLYVWWAGTHGMNIPAGEHFRILGDPRVPPRVMSAHGIVDSIQKMLQDGVVEFCSSPAPVVDNNRPDGRSMALFSKDGDPYLDTVPLSKAELETRVLPIITPVCTYDPDKSEILIDWLGEKNLEIHDSFVVTVTPPGGKPLAIKCGVDKQTRYTVKEPGIYTVLVTLTAVDQRSQDGVETEITVPEP